MCANKRLACFYFWREIGRCMNIRDVPADYDTFEKFNRDYERAHYRFTEANRRVGSATRELLVSWFPKLFAPLVRKTIYALLDDSLIEAFGFDRSSPLMRSLGHTALKVRGALAGLLPTRRRPRLGTKIRHPSYPNGYVIQELGPPNTNL